MISNLTSIWLSFFLKLVSSLELFFIRSYFTSLKLLSLSEGAFYFWSCFLSRKYMTFFIKYSFVWSDLRSLKSKFCVLSHFWSLMLLSSELILFWSYFLELMVESGYWTWFRAKNPIDEELRRKNLVWFNFPGSQNLKLSLCVFF